MTTITLPFEIEQSLAEAAKRHGTTPERLALEGLRKLYGPEGAASTIDQSNLLEFLNGYVGTVAGSSEAFSERCGERFADGLAKDQKKGA